MLCIGLIGQNKHLGGNILFIRLFIRTVNHKIADDIAKRIITNIPDGFMGNVNYKIEPYWKFNDTLVAEIQLKLLKDMDDRIRNEFLYSISDRWIYYDSGNEALSSKTMEGGCNIKFDDIDMVNIFFANY